MDPSAAFGLLAVLLLVLVNGFFVATEFAIVAVRRSRLEQLAREGHPAARAAQEIVGHLDAYIAACQLGITMASLALGWIGEPALARVIERPLARARTRNPELFLLVALAIGLGTAALSQAVGLSTALGAFLAGLIIGESDYAHETLARVLPLRDAFVALFFVTVGALIDPASLFASLPVLGTMVALIVAGKLMLWTVIARLFGYPFWTALLAGTGLTQIGEFSFVLVQAGRAAGHVGDAVYNATLAASLVTILINVFLVRAVPRWVGRARLCRPSAVAAPAVPREGHVTLCGFGRVGSAVGESLATFHIPYVAVDNDPDVVRGLRARGRLRCGPARRRGDSVQSPIQVSTGGIAGACRRVAGRGASASAVPAALGARRTSRSSSARR